MNEITKRRKKERRRKKNAVGRGGIETGRGKITKNRVVGVKTDRNKYKQKCRERKKINRHKMIVDD